MQQRRLPQICECREHMHRIQAYININIFNILIWEDVDCKDVQPLQKLN